MFSSQQLNLSSNCHSKTEWKCDSLLQTVVDLPTVTHYRIIIRSMLGALTTRVHFTGFPGNRRLPSLLLYSSPTIQLLFTSCSDCVWSVIHFWLFSFINCSDECSSRTEWPHKHFLLCIHSGGRTKSITQTGSAVKQRTAQIISQGSYGLYKWVKGGEWKLEIRVAVKSRIYTLIFLQSWGWCLGKGFLEQRLENG